MIRYLLLLVFFVGQFLDARELSFERPTWRQLTFDYSPAQLVHIKELPKPKTKITAKRLNALTKEVAYLTSEKKLTGLEQTNIPPYLANAQKDFAWLSYLLTGDFIGDLGPVTLWTLQLFIPEATLSHINEKDFDVYTASLATQIVKKAAERLNAEKKQIKDYPIKHGKNLWHPTSPGYRGLNFGSAKTWFLSSSKEHLAETPPLERNDFWKSQCLEILNEQKNLDGEKIEKVFKWAGLTSPKAGNWSDILTEYLEENNVPLSKQLYIRSLLLSALADSNAAAFHSKYTYWIPRPSQYDPSIRPLITIPNHPSYPSAHSTIASTAATILTKFFPNDSEKWQNLANESGMSRIWGGIHYPCDHKAGLKLGEHVANTVLERASKKERSLAESTPVRTL